MSNAHNMKIYFKIFIQYWFVVINVDTFFKIADQNYAKFNFIQKLYVSYFGIEGIFAQLQVLCHEESLDT
jgi:hypothetical protein